MHKLEDIKQPVAAEMQLFEKKFRQSMVSKVALLNRITHYIVKRKGKQIRPMLVFLSAKLCGEVNDSTYRGAALIELMHTASLVHDDVVDDANERRGFFSINALWKNKIAVLVGDFLLARVLLLAVEHKDYGLLNKVSHAVKQMSEGELLQIEKARRLDISEDIYFDIIRQKTASLLRSCCAVGALSVGADEETIAKMEDFGESIGIAFQIRDDLFDYQLDNKSGKPTGIDIKERKMTLPLIYTLEHANKSDKRFIMNTFKSHSQDKIRVNQVIDMVLHSGGMAYAEKKMEHYRAHAETILNSFPDSEIRESLKNLLLFVLNRKK